MTSQADRQAGVAANRSMRGVGRGATFGLLSIALSLPAAAIGADRAAGRSSEVDFASQIYPMLRRACFECHGPEKQEADLRLDVRNEAFEAGMIVAGDPENSELLRRVSLPREDPEVMPARGETLARQQIATIRDWIRQGADWPEDLQVATHWAYVAPERPQRPVVSDAGWPSTDIDWFVLQRLDREGLEPSPPAEPETLVRRVFLDLIGLPPSPAETDAFLADPSESAYDRLVDDLLSRPQFGERWARPWLDLARYADSHGFQRDNLRDVWAYRDWVIRALNEDMPFDQFTLEQVAGDLLPDATESQRIATGFHRCAPTNVEAGSLPEETRVEQVLDRVNTTGAVWLGTTLECCQCHDHKYDPFTMRDYYRLLAFFNSTEAEADRSNPNVPSSIEFRGPTMPLSDPQRDARRGELERELAGVRWQQTQRREELAAGLEEWAADRVQRAGEVPQTHVLEVLDFQSRGTTDTFELLEDGSVLLVGNDPPDSDVYVVRVRARIDSPVRAFRLDALTHDSLPGKGPGRGDAKRTNFVLNEFSVTRTGTAAAQGGGTNPLSPHRLTLVSAQADFSQPQWDVAGAIDGDAKTGWAIAPKFGEPHWATFLLDAPLAARDGVELTFRLEHHFGSARSIGRLRLSALTGDVAAESIPAAVLKIARQPAGSWSPEDRRRLVDFCAERDDRMRALGREMARLENALKPLAPDTTLVMVELDRPRPTHVFQRGDYRQPGELVQPGVPEILHPLPAGPANRLALARWLVDPANPLVARVTVNRWWAELFGTGLVPTVEDFGIKGDPPSHPELLDWLAVEFVESGWSRKHILRTIVRSSTYRQSSRLTPELLARDDTNRWLARGPRLRLDAEMIRDNALAISGLLSGKQFGPPIRPYQPDGIWSKVGGTNYEYVVSPGEDRYRRGVYVILKRGAPYPSFVNFDGSARLACTVKRSRTNTPLQALTLLNDPVYVEAARALVERTVRETSGAGVDDRLRYAFRLCTARRPAEFELRTLRTLYENQLQAGREAQDTGARAAGGVTVPEGISPAEWSGWNAVATALLNLHETITKE